MRSTQDGRGKTALVTGASAGIGEAFARQLAQRGFDLVVVARRQHRLADLQTSVQAQTGVRVHPFAADLAQPGAPQRIFDELRARGTNVDVLVNNAGYGVPHRYVATRWQDQADLIQVMVTAVAHLCHLFLPGMTDRGYGRIVNVASIAGLLPGTAGHTLYAAAKAFCIKLSESLALETADSGVHVTALCPGFTRSEFHDVTGTRQQVDALPELMWMDADTVARQGIDAVMRGDPLCVNGPVNKGVVGASRLLPHRLNLWLSRRASKRVRAE